MEKKITAWIARDELDDKIVLHLHKPNSMLKSQGMWHSLNVPKVLDKDIFPEVKWEDEEPTEVELTIKIKERYEKDNV